MTGPEAFVDRLDDLEHQVAAGAYREAVDSLVAILDNLEYADWWLGASARVFDEITVREAGRLAAQIIALVGDEGFQVTYAAFSRLCRYKRNITQVLELAGYYDADGRLPALGTRQADGRITLSAQETVKMLLLQSINVLTPAWVSLLSKQPARTGIPALLGFLSENLAWSERARQARAALLHVGDDWMDHDIAAEWVGAVVSTYMGCSYDSSDDKHEIKKLLNALVRRYAVERGCSEYVPNGPRPSGSARPRIVVLAESYSVGHAMHRIYGASIESLKDRFETILMTGGAAVDDGLEDAFSTVDDTPLDQLDPDAFCRAVRGHRPEILYFPSVGMRLVSILASNLRLAPIQVMTFGHPATTYSPCIDYAIAHHGVVPDPATISETVIERDPAVRFLDHPQDGAMEPIIRERPQTVRLAVPAWIRKVTPEFLAACRMIADRTMRPVRFVFFPNVVGTAYQAFRRRVERLLPAVVYPTTTYPDYLERLNGCDVFLSTFPFGAANGIIDAAKCGLPIVNLRGREMHAITDSVMSARLGLPGWLSADSVEAYVNATLALVHDNAKRVAVSRDLVSQDVGATFLHDAPVTDFAQIFDILYRRHEHITASRRHLWTHAELMALDSRRADGAVA